MQFLEMKKKKISNPPTKMEKVKAEKCQKKGWKVQH